MVKRDEKYVVVVNNARERAYRILRDRIMYLELAPGTLISTKEVAEELNISRTPVREAFLELSADGLLDISPQRSTLVSRIDMKRVAQEMFVREALEMANMRTFVMNPSEATISEMGRKIEEQREALDNYDFIRYQELDDEFHSLPFIETSQDLSSVIVTQKNGHYGRIRMLVRKSREISNDIVWEHEKLLESIKKRDLYMTMEALRYHIWALQPLQDKLQRQYPDFFV